MLINVMLIWKACISFIIFISISRLNKFTFIFIFAPTWETTMKTRCFVCFVFSFFLSFFLSFKLSYCRYFYNDIIQYNGFTGKLIKTNLKSQPLLLLFTFPHKSGPAKFLHLRPVYFLLKLSNIYGKQSCKFLLCVFLIFFIYDETTFPQIYNTLCLHEKLVYLLYFFPFLACKNLLSLSFSLLLGKPQWKQGALSVLCFISFFLSFKLTYCRYFYNDIIQ